MAVPAGSEDCTELCPVTLLLVGLELRKRHRVVPSPPRFERAPDGSPRLPDPPAVKILPVLLAGFIPFGKAASGRQWRGFDVDEEVAASLDENRHGDGL